MEKPLSITSRKRFWLWLAAWLAATAAVTLFRFEMLRFTWWFPMGLLFHFASDDFQDLVLTVGWFLYVGLSVYGLTRRDRRSFYLAYAILIVLLALNVTGCHVEMSQMKFGC